MKKLFCMIALAAIALTAWSQTPLRLSTYNGTSLERYAGKQCDVTVERYLFTGWNTISLPVDVTEQELDEVLGQGVKLERLVGVNQNGTEIVLNFQDCKSEGIQANVPYILYYPGEPGNKKIRVSAHVETKEPVVAMTTGGGVKVAMTGAALKTDAKGLYGILAINNGDANFTYVDKDNVVFYATRCFINIPGDQQFTLRAHHMAAGEVTSITSIAAASDIVDVYNVLGVRVAHNIKASDVNNLDPNIYIVNGHKVLVK